MDLTALLALLELNAPGDFEYFEDLAGILEAEEDIPVSTLMSFFEETDPDTVAELVKNYFEDILESMPDDSTDMYLLLENIARSLRGLLLMPEGADIPVFAEEISRFRIWYNQDPLVECEGVDSGERQRLPLKEALVLSRLEKLDGEEQRYDFTACLDYPLDEYIMQLGVSEEEADPYDGFLEDPEDEYLA